jgi:3',5'-cyclic AMP phosphodiesterase CpdA
VAAGALALACACAPRTSPDFVLRPVAPGPAAASFPVAARVIHFADFGDDTPQQAAVAGAMAAASRSEPVDLVLSPGDNLYECGPDPLLAGAAACEFGPDQNAVPASYVPPVDKKFQELFEKPLAGIQRDGKPVPTFLTLGNHDVAGAGSCGAGGEEARVISRRRACLEVAHRSAGWSMPGRHWVRDQGPARFIGFDSNLLLGNYGGFSFDDEVAFVTEAARPCGEKLCFIVAHHPSFSAGEHRDASPEFLARVKRIEAAAAPFAAWLSGHEHQLEHLRAPSGYDVLVSGNASRGRPKERFQKLSAPGAQLLFASTRWGFGVLEVGEGGRWSYRFVDDAGRPIQCCSAPAWGRCEPVSCPSR